MVGILGNVLILGSFVLCIGTVFAYYRATNDQRAGVESNWLRLGRLGWTLSTTMLFGASGLLWYLLFTHDFSYYYVWKNTSLDLPPYYLISSLWAGQEGSFMVWMMFTGLTGWGVIKYGRHLEAPSMAVIAFCQMFMISMIVGLQFGSVPIGSDPFKLLTTHFPDAPFLQNGGTPPDGNGLNDLLKNPWMAIHPPTMFIGFALMIVPFAYAIAGLWTRDYSSWVKPALPWALFSAMMLGSGLLMGGYWAYVTLSFGGYWAWDPVENSSLVPWLIGVAAIHTMLAQKRSGQSYKASILLNIIAYMLVVYSTFLTRSGILGDISVHSFVDLGLNNQLLLWILSMGAIGFGLYIKRYKELPTPKKEPALLSREFMIFSGAMLLCAISLVIILGTSAPIFGRIFRDNPSGVPIEFYNKWSLPITAVIAFLIGLGQLFWWNRMKVENVNKVLLWPLVASVAGTVLILVVTPFAEAMRSTMMGPSYGIWMALLLFSSFFALSGNAIVLWRIGRGNLRLAGGAVTHIGFAFMLFGILASTGFNNPLTEEGVVDRDSFIINQGQTVELEGYTITYSGQEQAELEGTAYILDVVDHMGREYTMKPIAYKSRTDQWIQHPDVQAFVEQDLYVAVNPSARLEEGQPRGEGDAEEFNLRQGETGRTSTGNYALFLKGLDPGRIVEGDDGRPTIQFNEPRLQVDQYLNPDDLRIVVAAQIEAMNLSTGESRTLWPIYALPESSDEPQFLQSQIEDWGLKLTFAGIDLDADGQDAAARIFAETPREWLLVQAYEKPAINFLWYGFFLMLGGFGLAMWRRIQDQHVRRRTPERFVKSAI